MDDEPSERRKPGPRGPHPGNFQPGKSGNPGGRKRGAEKRARDVVESRQYVAKDGSTYSGLDALLHVLLDIAFDQGERAHSRIHAACRYVDRGWGAVKQSVQITADAQAAGRDDLDPAKMSDSDLREALGAIGTLKRLGAVAAEADGANDGPTEH